MYKPCIHPKDHYRRRDTLEMQQRYKNSNSREKHRQRNSCQMKSAHLNIIGKALHSRHLLPKFLPLFTPFNLIGVVAVLLKCVVMVFPQEGLEGGETHPIAALCSKTPMIGCLGKILVSHVMATKETVSIDATLFGQCSCKLEAERFVIGKRALFVRAQIGECTN